MAAFASQFLVQRLSRFYLKFPRAELEFLTSIRLVDLAREEFDIAIRYGRGGWDDVISVPITDGRCIQSSRMGPLRSKPSSPSPPPCRP